jgi:4-hydroxy-3-polyprenylbenzoate decarboxylase
MSEYQDVRDLVKLVEERGKLVRFKRTINKDTELVPLFRVQLRGLPESERRVFHFEDVVGSNGNRYEMSVLMGIYGASESILATGIGCQSYMEMMERWHTALTRPINPVLIDHAPVQEEVHEGKEIKELGLDEFPVPVEEPGFSGMIRTGLPVITKDPETHIRNVGTYNSFFRARDRLVAGIAPARHAMAYHWQTARRRGEGLPVAIVIGCAPSVMLASSASIPYGTDELAVAGAAIGSPIELVRCRTIPLEVPAHAEAIIEGVISTKVTEPLLPFGEYPGYFCVDHDNRPVIEVTAITHRKNAMFTPIIVGYPPSDNNIIGSFCESAQLYHCLKYERQLPVEEVYSPQMGWNNFCLIRVSKGTSQKTIAEVLKQAGQITITKYIVALDYEINLRDPELVIWALSYTTQPKDDFTIVPGPPSGLDPSAAPMGSRRNRLRAANDHGCSRVLINATRKWPYPPLGLPRKEYMERALQLWQEQGDLPTPRLREPYYGYSLGYWDARLQEYADLIVQGEYLKVGEKTAQLQVNVEDKL